jgi:SSS family solute:Na+ symporter
MTTRPEARDVRPPLSARDVKPRFSARTGGCSSRHRSVAYFVAAAALISMLLVSGLAAAATGSGNISSVATTKLPPLPDAAPADITSMIALATIDGRAIAIQSTSAWVLTEDRAGWARAEWREGAPAGAIRAAIGDGRRAFVLLGASEPESDGAPAGEIARVGRVELEGNALRLRELAPLPVRLSHAVGAPQGETLYIAGTDAAGAPHMLRLLLSEESQQQQWTSLPAWPGGGSPTSLVSQNSALYLTVHDEGQPDDRVLRWSSDPGWQSKGNAPGSIVGGSGRAVGQAHIVYLLSGAEGPSAAEGAAGLETFHTISSSWARLPYEGTRPLGSVAPWGSGLLLAQPSESGGVQLEAAEIKSKPRHLQLADWIIVTGYLGAMLSLGVYFYVRSKKGSTADFFVGSRSIPFWAAGVSIFATNTSSISYIATPAKAFETDWQYMTGKVVTVLGLMFVAIWVVPLLRRLNLVSVFNYLEMRFNPVIRMLASALCMLMHVGSRMSVVLFLPALAIATITGIDVVWSILLMGVCTIIYTTMGGMRAVVWTDFFQVIVLMGGALFAIGYVFYSLGGTAIYETAMAYDKTHMFNFKLDLTEPTVWGFLLLILFDTVLTFPKDQVLMQRTLATSSDKNAGRSIWVFAAVLLPGGFIFYVIGTVLFAYYKAHPERMDPLLPIDATFPLFIAAELPTGVTGLIIAGIFAAAMGTLSSTINSVATLLSVDFYERLAKNPTQRSSVRFAEWMSVVIGLVGIGLALVLSRYDIHSLLDLTIELAGLLGGGFAGAYTLGMFTRRANSGGVTIGIATAIVVTMAAWFMSLVHPYFYLGISILVCIVVGYCASYLFPAPTRSLEGLTIRNESVPLRAAAEPEIKQ